MRLALLVVLVLAACGPPAPRTPAWKDDSSLRTNVYLDAPPEFMERP